MPTKQAPETTAEAVLHKPPSEQLLAIYEQAGAMIVRGLIQPDWLHKLHDCYARMTAAAIVPSVSGGMAARKLIVGSGMWQSEEVFREFLFGSPIARAAASIMRSRRAQLYEDLLITEPAGADPHDSWHQDEGSWPVEGCMLSSVWFSLDPAGAETGAMKFVENSHNGPIYQPPHIDLMEAGDDVERWTGGKFPRVMGDRDMMILQTETEPGDAIIFHPRAIHCSYGSSPSHSRRSFTIRFLGDDVRWLPRNYMYHDWMKKLDLKRGDVIDDPRFPVVYEAPV
jgi:ectoine hydroxylase-related dioxygenase (phytanoyl-CoA dioxygenase family)